MANCYDFPTNEELGALLWKLNSTGEISLPSWDYNAIKSALTIATPSNKTQQMLADYFANSNRTQFYDANNGDNIFSFTKYVVEPIKDGVCVPSEYYFNGAGPTFSKSSMAIAHLLIVALIYQVQVLLLI